MKPYDTGYWEKGKFIKIENKEQLINHLENVLYDFLSEKNGVNYEKFKPFARAVYDGLMVGYPLEHPMIAFNLWMILVERGWGNIEMRKVGEFTLTTFINMEEECIDVITPENFGEVVAEHVRCVL